MIRILSVWMLVLFTACVAPNQHDESKWGLVKIALGASLDENLPWLPGQITEIEKALVALNALGPAFVIVPEGDAEFVIRPFVSKACKLQTGRFAPGTRFAECDPVCTEGYMGLRTCVMHETGHLLGMKHVCLKHREDADCSPVGYGYAIMNPALFYGDTFDDTEPSASTDRPTDLDLAEFRRVHP